MIFGCLFRLFNVLNLLLIPCIAWSLFSPCELYDDHAIYELCNGYTICLFVEIARTLPPFCLISLFFTLVKWSQIWWYYIFMHILCFSSFPPVSRHHPSSQFRFPWLADNLMSEHSSSDGSERARNVNWFPVAVAAAEDADDGGVLSSPNSTVSFFQIVLEILMQ